MSERIRRGSREYQFRHADPRRQTQGRKLGPREASALVRSLRSREAREAFRRIAFGAARADRQSDPTERMVEAIGQGRVEVWVVEVQRSISERRERPEPPPIAPPDNHSVVIELVDADNNPVPFEPYRIKLPDGRVLMRTLDEHGRDRVSGIREPGQCMVCFHRRDAAIWARA